MKEITKKAYATSQQLVNFQPDTLTFQFLSTNRFGDFRSRCTIVGVLVCKQFMPLACKLECSKIESSSM